ncbi:DUF1990 family protein [Promicromonospora sukumoe]|uniref:DUF1990 family protein n=1 Tax=Promicromonospora sukumoe TaxID=88382 RepID=UPI003650ADC9
MGAFNSLQVTIACPSCRVVAPREVQFRYGAVWQYRYELGDVLRWDRSGVVGNPAASHVVVDAWLCECPDCDHHGRIALYVRQNVLTAVGPVEDVPQLAELEWMPLPPEQLSSTPDTHALVGGRRDLGGIMSEDDGNSDERMGLVDNDLSRRALSYAVAGDTTPVDEQWRPPDGWRAYEHTVRLGSGTDLWDAASSAVLSWGIKTRSGFAVDPPLDAGRSARPNERYWLVARIGPFRVREPVQIITTVSTRNRAALTYGTLEGHPVSGEEAFIVHRDDDDVSLTLRSLTRAGRGVWRGLFPLILIAQRVYRRRYLRALRPGEQ